MTNETFSKYLNDQGLSTEGNQVTMSGLRVSFQVQGEKTLFVAACPAKAGILLAPESHYTQQADKIGVSAESKIGEGDFDARYVIRDPDGKASQILSAEVVKSVEALEPFIELEMTPKQYRLLKSVSDEQQAMAAIKGLQAVVELTKQ